MKNYTSNDIHIFVKVLHIMHAAVGRKLRFQGKKVILFYKIFEGNFPVNILIIPDFVDPE